MFKISTKADFGKIQNDAFEAKSDLNHEIKALKEHADKVEQAIRALEEMKHNLDSFCRAFEISGKTYWKISKLYDDGNIKGYSGFKDNYEKAELGCIRELIEILKSKKNENNI